MVISAAVDELCSTSLESKQYHVTAVKLNQSSGICVLLTSLVHCSESLLATKSNPQMA